jgi:hypothetical protein
MMWTLRKRAPPPEPGANPAYSYKPSLVGAAWQFELTDQGLAWRAGARSGLWPYASITRIRLSHRPISMQQRRFRADLRNDAGRSLALISVSWQTAALVAPQDESYRRFVTQLHDRIAAAGGRPLLLAGVTQPVYVAGVIALGLVNIALIGLFVRAAVTAAYGAMLYLAGFAALLGWKIGGLLVRNRPRPYRLDALPADVIP